MAELKLNKSGRVGFASGKDYEAKIKELMDMGFIDQKKLYEEEDKWVTH